MLAKIKNIEMIDYLFLVTISFFVISMVNITLAFLGLLCMVLPFVLLFRTGEKLWCKSYCPRSKLFNKLLSKISLGNKMPKWLTNKKLKYIVVGYFFTNFFIAMMSSVMVYLGRVEPAMYVKMFMFFKAPFTLPQLFNWPVHEALVHAGYRIFSMFLSTTILGLGLGLFYRPRTWCIICPIQTLTTTLKKN